MSSSISQPARAIKAKASRIRPLPTTLYGVVAGVVLYEYVVRGDSFAEPGVGVYKNFGGWDALFKVSGKTLDWANLETAFSKRIDKNWKLTATAYVWDSRSLLGERNSLKLKDNKTAQASVGVAYEY